MIAAMRIGAPREIKNLKNGLNVCSGQVTCREVAEALGYPYVEPDSWLKS